VGVVTGVVGVPRCGRDETDYVLCSTEHATRVCHRKHVSVSSHLHKTALRSRSIAGAADEKRLQQDEDSQQESGHYPVQGADHLQPGADDEK